MRSLSLPKVFKALSAAILLGGSHVTLADCDPMTVRQMLDDGGWSFEAETNESGEGVFSITSDGFTIQLLVERDGDSQFVAFYVDTQLSRQQSLEWINEASASNRQPLKKRPNQNQAQADRPHLC